MDVLIVEDEAHVRMAHALILERAGFMVHSVENGLEAIAALQVHPYRAVICDVRMPFLEGRRFYDELKKEYPQLKERVVFVTAWASDPDIREFAERERCPLLGKPVDMDELIRTVRRVAEQTK